MSSCQWLPRLQEHSHPDRHSALSIPKAYNCGALEYLQSETDVEGAGWGGGGLYSFTEGHVGRAVERIRFIQLNRAMLVER
jgi:hypothetical protein